MALQHRPCKQPQKLQQQLLAWVKGLPAVRSRCQQPYRLSRDLPLQLLCRLLQRAALELDTASVRSEDLTQLRSGHMGQVHRQHTLH